jgi:hypothetical protein
MKSGTVYPFKLVYSDAIPGNLLMHHLYCYYYCYCYYLIGEL